MSKTIFEIQISTRNRKSDLGFTLQKIAHLFQRNDVKCVIFDDGSSDGTFEFVTENFSEITIRRNEYSKGYLYCRNQMLNETKADFAISLDDDAHFITQNPLEIISEYFFQNPNCGLQAFRLFWSMQSPISTKTNEVSHRVKGFVGCGHVWRMNAWRSIPNYPEWFEFYGEEDFAAYQLFKKNWEIHYVPEILVQHRVNLQSRKKNTDYAIRLQRSLRSGWYLYFLFLPSKRISKKFAYSLWMQFKLKVFKGDLKSLFAIIKALFNLLFNFPKIIANRNSLSNDEYQSFFKLEETKIYWNPNDENL
ncbi:MAG: glycosyltransferase [Bacteroidota bacterium]